MPRNVERRLQDIPEDIQTRTFFLTSDKKCATRITTGEVVVLPTGYEVNPQLWDLSTLEYVALALLALERNPDFTVLPEYDNGCERFPFIDVARFGWGMHEKIDGEPGFVLYGSYH